MDGSLSKILEWVKKSYPKFNLNINPDDVADIELDPEDNQLIFRLN